MPVTPVPARRRSAKPGSSDQRLDADDPEPRLQRRAVDPDALDRARCGALAAADLGALERRAGRATRRRAAGRGCRGRSRRSCRRRRRASIASVSCGSSARITPGRVRADVAGDARQHVDAGARDAPAAPAPTPASRTAASVASANGAEPSGIGSMPSRRWCMIGLPTIASSRISSRLHAGPLARLGEQAVERLADGASSSRPRRPRASSRTRRGS